MLMRDVPERPLEPQYKAEAYPTCPECGAEAEDFYYKDGICVGCDHCLTKKYYLEVSA